MWIDFLCLLVLVVVTWSVASEGPLGAGLDCLCVILAGLLAMNFFEPLAEFCTNNIAASRGWAERWDPICLIGLFAFFVWALRSATVYLTPEFVYMRSAVFELGRWTAALLTGYVTMAFLLTAYHTAPLPEGFLGFVPQRANFFDLAAPDRQWLGFVHYVTEKSLNQSPPRIFDGPRVRLGDPQRPYPNEIWPSFPIRYAARRRSITGAPQPAPETAPVKRVQPAPSRPSGSSPGF
ncbi:MAG: CvpA family protein [Planctomycetota bacterium]|nr:MAG: CvpA family protein [Planctomycetota bacterium]